MSYFINFIHRLRLQEQSVFLGRWKIIYCKSKMNKKIDLANEDHCGICYSTKYHNISNIKQIPTYNKNPIIDIE